MIDKAISDAFVKVLGRDPLAQGFLAAPQRHSRKVLSLPRGGGTWESLVNGWLIYGYGVEDIAKFLDCHPDRVREHVNALRASGMLNRWFSREAA